MHSLKCVYFSAIHDARKQCNLLCCCWLVMLVDILIILKVKNMLTSTAHTDFVASCIHAVLIKRDNGFTEVSQCCTHSYNFVQVSDTFPSVHKHVNGDCAFQNLVLVSD